MSPYLPDFVYSLTWNVWNMDGVLHHYNILKYKHIDRLQDKDLYHR